LIAMEQQPFDVLKFLREPLHTACVATTTRSGRPALATMWFLVAAREEREVAVLVSTFDPPTDVRQFRAVGPSRLEKRDVTRVRRIYERYIPEWTPSWDSHAASTNRKHTHRNCQHSPRNCQLAPRKCKVGLGEELALGWGGEFLG
jgi:hypothetical protein